MQQQEDLLYYARQHGECLFTEYGNLVFFDYSISLWVVDMTEEGRFELYEDDELLENFDLELCGC